MDIKTWVGWQIQILGDALEVAGVERYSALLGPVFKIFLRTSAASWYWDSQLKENGVYEERFAQPYAWQ